MAEGQERWRSEAKNRPVKIAGSSGRKNQAVIGGDGPAGGELQHLADSSHGGKSEVRGENREAIQVDGGFW